MIKCPTCNLLMESHSTSELMECCMKQVDNDMNDFKDGICPNCQYDISRHTDSELAECTIAFLKSGTIT